MEDIVNEREYYKAMSIAMRMLADGKLSYEEIARYTDLPLEDVKNLAETELA